MGVRDIIKKSFLNQLASADLSTRTILLVLGITAVIGIYIFFVYRLVCRKAFYNRSFAISLVVIAMITSIIILTVQSSVVISLGMVGALSIVRFRTAIKDPMDLAFLFWAIAVGIICGANLYEVAIDGTIVITIVMLLLHMIPNVRPAVLLLVNASDAEVENALCEILKKQTTYYKVKSRNITSQGMDMIVELKTKEEAELLKNVAALQQVYSASLMTHDGEVTY